MRGFDNSLSTYQRCLQWDIEQAFKELKHDLAIRPIYHQTDARIEAHILVAFLAYCLQVTLKQRLRSRAPGLTPRSVLDKMSAIQMVDVHLPTTDARTVILSRYTEPEPDLALLLGTAEAQLARPTAPKDHVGRHSDIEMTAAPVVPTLEDLTTGNRPPREIIRRELRKTG